MDEGAWDALAPAMSSALRTSRCDAAYGGVWTRSNSSFPRQVDDAVQARGLSDDWLDQVAQAGQGELLLVVAELSTPAAEPDPASSHGSYSPQGSSPRVGNAGSALALLSLMAIAMLSNSLVIDAAPTPRASQDMIAILFSRRVHRPVAATRLHYVGGSLPDARRLFAQQLATAMPGLTCAGWAAAAPTVKPESEE